MDGFGWFKFGKKYESWQTEQHEHHWPSRPNWWTDDSHRHWVWHPDIHTLHRMFKWNPNSNVYFFAVTYPHILGFGAQFQQHPILRTSQVSSTWFCLKIEYHHWPHFIPFYPIPFVPLLSRNSIFSFKFGCIPYDLPKARLFPPPPHICWFSPILAPDIPAALQGRVETDGPGTFGGHKGLLSRKAGGL